MTIALCLQEQRGHVQRCDVRSGDVIGKFAEISQADQGNGRGVARSGKVLVHDRFDKAKGHSWMNGAMRDCIRSCWQSTVSTF